MARSLITAAPTPTDEEQPFKYGWRFVKRVLPDGTTALDEVPLTLEDVLHPQEDDVIPERSLQEQERGYLAWVFRTRLRPENGGLVLSDCLVNWGVPGVRNTSPDVSAFADLRVPHNPEKGTFQLKPSGGRCLFAIELVSPDTRTNDVDRKPDIYDRAGVPLYVIVDQEREDGPRKILGYRHTPPGWQLVALDQHGRLPLPELGLTMGLVEGRVMCFDAQTGKMIGDYVQITQALEAEEQARKAAEQARQAAEQQARAEAQARQAAEERLRKVEEQLRQLRGDSSTP